MLTVAYPPARVKRKRRRKLPAEALRVMFHDEAPRIGCGHRIVVVLSAGRKWAKLKDVSSGARARLPIKVWQAIAKSAL